MSSKLTRTVALNDGGVAEVHCRIRYDTWIILPKGEVIVDVGAGDPDNWVIRVSEDKTVRNLVHVKPSVSGSTTNMNIRTKEGRIYSFLLVESAGQPDLKLFIAAPKGSDPIVAVDHMRELADKDNAIRDLQEDLAAAKHDVIAATAAADKRTTVAIAAFRSAYPLQLRCNYQVERGRFSVAPFYLEAACDDGVSTYIKLGCDDVPSLFSDRDGKLGIVDSSFNRNPFSHGGTLVVPSIIYRGQLRLGKKKLTLVHSHVVKGK